MVPLLKGRLRPSFNNRKIFLFTVILVKYSISILPHHQMTNNSVKQRTTPAWENLCNQNRMQIGSQSSSRDWISTCLTLPGGVFTPSSWLALLTAQAPCLSRRLGITVLKRLQGEQPTKRVPLPCFPFPSTFYHLFCIEPQDQAVLSFTG